MSEYLHSSTVIKKNQASAIIALHHNYFTFYYDSLGIRPLNPTNWESNTSCFVTHAQLPVSWSSSTSGFAISKTVVGRTGTTICESLCFCIASTTCQMSFSLLISFVCYYFFFFLQFCLSQVYFQHTSPMSNDSSSIVTNTATLKCRSHPRVRLCSFASR